MKKGIIILLIVSIIIMLLPVINEYISGHGEMSEIDVVEVNQLISEIESSDDMVVTKSSGKYTFDYTILDLDQNVIYTSVDEKSENYAWTIVEATKNRDTIRDLNKGEKLRGWLIIYNNTIFIERIIRTRYERSYYISFIFCLILWIIYGVYIYIKVIRPFDKMKDFASAVAMGELDKPLEMDRGNIFGAFTESFDIMREELEISRKREYEANVSKRELVANLSHDIKTPVASIKAMSELLEIKSESSGDDFVNKKAKSIGGKADQIDTLVSNLFASTLKELEKLEVNASELESEVRIMRKNVQEVEAVMKQAYDLYYQIKDEEYPPEITSRVLEIARNTHEIKGDYQNVMTVLDDFYQNEN